jgi:hypothetical protein
VKAIVTCFKAVRIGEKHFVCVGNITCPYSGTAAGTDRKGGSKVCATQFSVPPKHITIVVHPWRKRAYSQPVQHSKLIRQQTTEETELYDGGDALTLSNSPPLPPIFRRPI